MDQKMLGNFSDGLDELYRRAKFGEDRTTRAGCRCENMVFVCFCHAPRPVRCSFDGCIVRTSIALLFIGRFLRGFQPFSEWIAFSGALHGSHFFVARWRQKFREIAVKNCEKPPILPFSLRSQMAPQQTDRFRTVSFRHFRSTLRNVSVANYRTIWTL